MKITLFNNSKMKAIIDIYTGANRIHTMYIFYKNITLDGYTIYIYTNDSYFAVPLSQFDEMRISDNSYPISNDEECASTIVKELNERISL